MAEGGGDWCVCESQWRCGTCMSEKAGGREERRMKRGMEKEQNGGMRAMAGRKRARQRRNTRYEAFCMRT